MSAFMLPTVRIVHLAIECVRARVTGRVVTGDLLDDGARATQVARALWHANAISVRARYGEQGESMIGEPTAEQAIAPITAWDVMSSHAPMKSGALAKLSHSFAYQACEAPTWDASSVKAMLDALEHQLMRQLPGYSDAEWG